MSKPFFRKRKKSAPHVDGVVLKEKKNILSLKPRIIHIELHGGVIRSTGRFIRNKSGVLMVFLAVLVVAAAAGLATQTKAEANLYPQACLGGWNDSAKAAGIPELDGSDTSKYSTSNSASVANALAQIYCGEFTGTIPENTVPTAITLRVSWSVGPTPAPAVMTGETYASSTDQILSLPDGKSTGLIIMESTSTPLVQPTPVAPVSVPETPPSEPTTPSVENPVQPAPEVPPQSFVPALMRAFAKLAVPRAYAESTDTATSGISSSSVATSTIENIAATTSATSTPPDGISGGMVEILYTLDGTTWRSVAVVPASSFSKASFQLPIEGISAWQDISKLQIEVRTLSSADPNSTIYIDGMWIEASYMPEKPKDLTKVPLTDGLMFAVDDAHHIIVHPKHPDGSSNLIFYSNTGVLSYQAGTITHGDVPIDEYYAPPPPPGKYVMLEYMNDGGSFDCNGLTAASCEASAHFVARTNFEVVETMPPVAPAGTEPVATDTASTTP